MSRLIYILLFILIPLQIIHSDPFKNDTSYLEYPTNESVYKVCKLYKIKYPEIVVAQAILETGHYTSKHCVDHNNLFGLYDSNNKQYYKFDHWTHSVKAYKNKVQYKYNGGNYYRFLDSIGYASDTNYVKLVKIIKKRLNVDSD